jgi:hypothetical protein
MAVHPIKFSETLAGILQCGGIAQQGSASGCNGAPDGGSIVRCTRSRTVSIARGEIRAEETKIMLVTECLSKELFKGKTVNQSIQAYRPNWDYFIAGLTVYDSISFPFRIRQTSAS